MNEFFQTYENHIPYLHQFFIDHNLFGMDALKVKDIWFRDGSIHMEGWKNLNLKKTTKSLIEIDIIGFSILNRLEIKERESIPLIASQKHESKTKLVPSLQNIWIV